MSRDHARIQTAIWRNREFRNLPRDAQHLYFAILSQPALSYCGVIDWWPNRLADLSGDGDEAAVYAAAKSLIDEDFIYIDEKTSEVLVRTYIRHDGVMQRTNMGKAMGRALQKVSSLGLIDIIFGELIRLHSERPDLQGWAGFADLYPEDFERVRDGVIP